MSANQKRQRLGVFGGSFDPIHIGHLLLAEQAREKLELDMVRFIPAARSPLKQHQAPSAADKQRLEMVRLAISGNAHFEVDDRELLRGGTSYTVDTLQDLANEAEQRELVFLMGSDSLVDLHAWRDPTRICQLAFVAILARGGHAPPDLDLLKPYLPAEQQQSLASHLVAMPQIEISSSDLRHRIAAGKSTRYQLHPAVQAYIHCEGLYQSTP